MTFCDNYKTDDEVVRLNAKRNVFNAKCIKVAIAVDAVIKLKNKNAEDQITPEK